MSERKCGNAGKGRERERQKLGLSFFIFVSTLPWDKSGVFPGLPARRFFSLPCGEKEVGRQCCSWSCFLIIDGMYFEAIDEYQKKERCNRRSVGGKIIVYCIVLSSY